MELEKVMSIIVLSISAWSALALLLDRRGQLQANRYFAILLGVLCISQIFNYTLLVASPAALVFGQLALASIWLKGPLILQLVQLLIGKKPGFKSIAWQFGGFPLALTINILVPQTQFLWHFFGACLSVAVLLWSIFVLRNHRNRLYCIAGEFKNTGIYWLLFVVLGMLTLLLADIALFTAALYLHAFPLAAAKAVTFAAAIYLICVAFFSIYRPEVFFHLGFPEKSVLQAADDSFIEACGPASCLADTLTPAGRNLELGDSVAATLQLELQRLMTVESIYRQDELSLTSIAKLLGVSVHQASELLNVHMHTNFYSYVNGYRLKYAAQLLGNPDCQLRVLDIVFESGFNNKNSFYREFRSVYGVTPTEYRSLQLLEAVS